MEDNNIYFVVVVFVSMILTLICQKAHKWYKAKTEALIIKHDD